MKNQIKSNEDCDTLVAHFVIDNLHQDMATAYRIVACLDYPLTDKKSLSDQLANLNNNEEFSQDIIEWIADSFKAEDFTIATAQSGLEKFYARITPDHFYGIDFNPRDFDFGSAPGPSPTPNAPIFVNDECGRAAERFFYEQLARWGSLAGMPGVYNNILRDAQDMEKRCKRAIPDFSGRCSEAARRAWAYCYVRGNSPVECARQAYFARLFCDQTRIPIPETRFPF